MTSGRFSLERHWIFFCLVTVVVSFSHFLFNLNLPDLFKGRVCCDSVEYIQIVNKHPQTIDLLSYSGIRTFGYPLYLALHRDIASIFSISDWVILSTFTSFFIFILSSILIFYAFIKYFSLPIHPVFLVLLLLHPGLSSHAALPLTDSITTSLYSVSLFMIGTAVTSATNKIYLFKIFIAGLILGFCVLIRPSFGPPVMGIALIGSILFAHSYVDQIGQFSRRNLMLSLLTAVVLVSGLLFVTGKQVANCKTSFGKMCFQEPQFTMDAGVYSIRLGLGSTRVFTNMTPILNTVVPDSFSKLYFADHCEISSLHPVSTLLKCYVARFPWSIVHLFHKLIGLFDNYALNTYAVNHTSDDQKLINRGFGMLGFLGFFCLLASFVFAFGTIKRKHILFPLIFCVLYLGFSLNFHIESRYGFPAVPFSILGLGIGRDSLKDKYALKKNYQLFLWLFGLIVFSGYFLFRTHLMDQVS